MKPRVLNPRRITLLRKFFKGENPFRKRERQARNNPESKEEAELLRQSLIAIQKAVERSVNSFYDHGTGAKARPYLDNTVVLKDVEGLGDLVSVNHLRDYEIWPSEVDYKFPETDEESFDKYLIEEADILSLPKDFLKEGSYIVLCIPNFTHQRDFNQSMDEPLSYVNYSYDVTVLYCKPGKVVKLPSDAEIDYRKYRKTIKFATRELIPAPLNPIKPGITEEVLVDGEVVPVWLGRLGRGFSVLDESINTANKASLEAIKRHFRTTVNGTIAYQLVSGSLQKKQDRSQEKSTAPVGQLSPVGIPI